jgi:hypothetical protein
MAQPPVMEQSSMMEESEVMEVSPLITNLSLYVSRDFLVAGLGRRLGC